MSEHIEWCDSKGRYLDPDCSCPEFVRHIANPQLELEVAEHVGKNALVLTDGQRWFSAELLIKEGIRYAALVNEYGDRATAEYDARRRP